MRKEWIFLILMGCIISIVILFHLSKYSTTIQHHWRAHIPRRTNTAMASNMSIANNLQPQAPHNIDFIQRNKELIDKISKNSRHNIPRNNKLIDKISKTLISNITRNKELIDKISKTSRHNIPRNNKLIDKISNTLISNITRNKELIDKISKTLISNITRNNEFIYKISKTSIRNITRNNKLIDKISKTLIHNIMGNNELIDKLIKTSRRNIPRNDERDITNNQLPMTYNDSRVKISQQRNSLPPELVEVKARAQMIANNKVVVAITMVNMGYLSLTYSWLCNTVNMNVHDNVLIVATDRRTYEKLQQDWPNVASVLYPLNEDQGSNLNYNALNYVKYMLNRSNLLLALLGFNIPLLLFEVDAVWFASPFPLIHSLSYYDLVGAKIATTEQMAGGFLFMQPTRDTLNVFTTVSNELQIYLDRYKFYKGDRQLPYEINEQTLLNGNLKYENGRPRLNYKILDLSIVADGQWYKKRGKQSIPLVLNNNWIIGKEAKIKRAKKFHHWFIDDNNNCDWEEVQNIMKLGKNFH
ncbi:unnamed protein product [Owenia fusiformis]|uniref:Nucleotide-diphospho-sugar transferase domain-containing protein n=1 Tax=Owenia fusiformis TaxID=6347 RepID=A0A8S4MXB3_OWEFU|nr:unnamed protein product [Owenia fusiformis]